MVCHGSSSTAFLELRYVLLLLWRIDVPLDDGSRQTAPAPACRQEEAIFRGDFAETVSATLRKTENYFQSPHSGSSPPRPHRKAIAQTQVGQVRLSAVAGVDPCPLSGRLRGLSAESTRPNQQGHSAPWACGQDFVGNPALLRAERDGSAGLVGPQAEVAAESAALAADGELSAAGELRADTDAGAGRPAGENRGDRQGARAGEADIVGVEVIVAVDSGVGRKLDRLGPGQGLGDLKAARGAAGGEVAAGLRSAERIGIGVVVFPQRVDGCGRLDQEAVALIVAFQSPGDQQAVAGERAGGAPRGAIEADPGIGDAGIEANGGRQPPAGIAASCPTVALEAALDGVGAIIKGLPAAEHADKEVRCQQAGQTGRC